VGFESSESAVAVLGLEGFVLLAAVEVDGELHQLVETKATKVGCSGCGTRALSKGRRRTKIRDLSCGGRPVVVVWAKRLWRCGDSDCDVKGWSETSPLIAPRASLTERARAEACRRVGQDNHAVAQVARSHVLASLKEPVLKFGAGLADKDALGARAFGRGFDADENSGHGRSCSSRAPGGRGCSSCHDESGREGLRATTISAGTTPGSAIHGAHYNSGLH